jgi:hypothetical protein
MIPPKPIKKPDFLAIIKRLQSALTKQEQKYTNQVIEAYTKSYKTIQPHIEKVTLFIEAHPDITQTGIKRSKEYHDLIDVTEKELNSFVDYARTTIGIAIEASALLALSAVAEWGLKPLEPNAMDVVTQFLQLNTPLSNHIGLWAGNARDGVIDAIIKGVGLGKDPQVIFQEVTKAFGSSLTDAIRTSDTAQHWAYMESERLNFIANGIDKWVWWVDFSGNPCGACIAMHGTIHDSTEQLDDHYNGNCEPIPMQGEELSGIQTGEEYFNMLSEDEQNKILGREKADAYRGGAFSLSDMAKTVADPVYGNMVVETPLWELLGAEAPLETGYTKE